MSLKVGQAVSSVLGKEFDTGKVFLSKDMKQLLNNNANDVLSSLSRTIPNVSGAFSGLNNLSSVTNALSGASKFDLSSLAGLTKNLGVDSIKKQIVENKDINPRSFIAKVIANNDIKNSIEMDVAENLITPTAKALWKRVYSADPSQPLAKTIDTCSKTNVAIGKQLKDSLAQCLDINKAKIATSQSMLENMGNNHILNSVANGLMKTGSGGFSIDLPNNSKAVVDTINGSTGLNIGSVPAVPTKMSDLMDKFSEKVPNVGAASYLLKNGYSKIFT